MDAKETFAGLPVVSSLGIPEGTELSVSDGAGLGLTKEFIDDNKIRYFEGPDNGSPIHSLVCALCALFEQPKNTSPSNSPHSAYVMAKTPVCCLVRALCSCARGAMPCTLLGTR